MKKLLATLFLGINLFVISTAQSAVLLYVNGAEYITYGFCGYWDAAIDSSMNVVECTDLGSQPPWDHPFPANPTAGSGPMAGEDQALTLMDGTQVPFMSKKAIKKFKKAIKKGNLTNKKMEKFLAYKGKTDKDLLKDANESYGTDSTRVSERLRHKGRAFDASSTCIDDIYNSRKATWKKMGLAPLEVLTGGLVGAGAAAGGTAIAVNSTARLPEVLASLGMSSGSIVGTAAMYGTAIGAIGMAAYVISKEIYFAVKLLRNAKMIDLISQARLPYKYGLTEDFQKFSRKTLKMKNPDSEDIDFIREEIAEMDRSGAFCQKGEITSYRKFKKQLKKRGKQYKKTVGKKVSVECSTKEDAISCKAKERANRSKCKSSLRNLPQDGKPFFLVIKEGSCEFAVNPPPGSQAMITNLSQLPHGGGVSVNSVELAKGTTHAFVKYQDKNQARFIRSRTKIAANGEDLLGTCEAATYKLHGENIIHRDLALRNAGLGRTKVGRVSCERTSISSGGNDDQETTVLTMKAKEKANKTKCSNHRRSDGQDTTVEGESGSCVATERTSKDGGKSVREFVHEAKVMAKHGNYPNVVHFVSNVTISEKSGTNVKVVETNTCSLKTDADGTSSKTCRYEGPNGNSECSLSLKKAGPPRKHQTAMSIIRNMK